MLGVFLAHFSIVLAQQNSSATRPLAEMKSTDWHQRWAAYEKIKSNAEWMKRSDVKSTLFDLFDRENHLITKTLSESNGETGVSDKYGEEYSEYYADLMSTVEKIADWRDQHQLCVFAESAYEPNSQFAAKLVADGGAGIAPCLLRMAHGSLSDRYKTIPVLVQLSGTNKNLTPAVRQQIRQAIIAGLRDPIVLVRQTTVVALGNFGAVDMIPMLESIARSDPVSRRLDNGQLRFDVRDAATKAIQSIQERTQAR